jgi:hypothetical protein
VCCKKKTARECDVLRLQIFCALSWSEYIGIGVGQFDFGGIGGESTVSDGEKEEGLALVSTRARAFFWSCLV